MSLKYKIFLPLVAAFLLSAGFTGLVAVDATGRAVDESFAREHETALGFLARMRPPLGDESLARMKELWKTELAAMEDNGKIVATTLDPRAAESLARAVAQGGAAGDGTRFAVDLGGRRFRAMAGAMDGPPGPFGGKVTLWVLLPESRVREAKYSAMRGAAAAALAGILVVLGASIAISRPFISRLANLSRAAERIAGGAPEKVMDPGRDEIAKFAGAFDRMVAALAESRDKLVAAEKMAALGKLASAVAHEIKNPLASMRMTADLLAGDFEAGEQREAIGLITGEITRLEMFVDEILSLSGSMRVNRRMTALSGILAGTADLLREKMAHVGVSLEISPGDGVEADVDPDKMKQVLINLALNAAHAAGRGGTVRFECSRAEGERARIRVVDSGPGVDPANEERIFEPFFTTREGGTGLGLAVSARIVESHGGRLTYRRDGGWTVFEVDLPLRA